MTRTSIAFDINKKNWNNKFIFPDMVYLDTNCLLDISQQRRYGKLIEDYLTELIQRNGMAIWSQHTLDEMRQVLHVNQYIKYAKSNNIKSTARKQAWKIAEDRVSDNDSINIAKQVSKDLDDFSSYLSQFGLPTEIDEKEVQLLSNHLYSNFGSNHADSKHLAIANLSGTNNIITQDSGFLRYPNTNVYGASNNISQAYTSRQSPAEYFDFRNLVNNNIETNPIENLSKNNDDEKIG